VKRTIFSHAWYVALLLGLLVLLLTACERPLQPREVLEAPTPTDPVVPVELPTPIPAIPEAPIEEATPPEEGEPVGEEAPVAEDVPPATAVPDESTPVTQPVEATPAGPVTYLVQAGDTLGRIAERYNVTVGEIAAANNISDIHRLDVGQTLIIPVGGVSTDPAPVTGEVIHIVQPGENLYRIGLRYGVTPEALAAHNGLSNMHRIYVGQELQIPLP
jgi:LysM repeat protein